METIDTGMLETAIQLTRDQALAAEQEGDVGIASALNRTATCFDAARMRWARTAPGTAEALEDVSMLRTAIDWIRYVALSLKRGGDDPAVYNAMYQASVDFALAVEGWRVLMSSALEDAEEESPEWLLEPQGPDQAA